MPVPRGGRLSTFAIALIGVLLLIYLSQQGALGPVRSVISVPLNFVQKAVSHPARRASDLADSLARYRTLERRNRDLEEALSGYQSEVATLREKANDYDRLSALLDYDRQGPDDREYATCDVIGQDTTGFVRAIQLDCGRRDGVEIMDPVVTELGMVGRVTQVSATGAEVLLLADPNSRVNARLQTSRADGVVIGQLGGDLTMSFIPVDAQVQEGDLVVTNGLGQVFPADLLLGQVMSVALAPNELYQEARVRSLVEFNRLEIVQVVINFEPVDLSVFEQESQPAP